MIYNVPTVTRNVDYA